ncbi:uncharacterized protein KY384_005831 [Bacidia gigantensis]|uniref:uncharacterized protein n=1 Tax=Bacidia gigantensis TaxID=2732470 RepID=UPI001D03FC40|nr:uncharacterized protein KY384_005831 [Bacidia gigantensis]KAG8529196.1 hypothetical protein KY384_005831 [Bacidia gigantensis]
MLLQLPASLHYPITVTELLKQPNDDVERFAPLFAYTFKSTVSEGDGLGNDLQVERTFPTRFESNVEGKLKAWKVKKGTVIAHSRSSYVTEQLDSSRATINMVHDNVSLTVSTATATTMEEEAKRRLLASKKLSLVVDLDQTIIHATVDPTVADWQKDESNPNHEAVKDVKSFLLKDDGPGNRGCFYFVKLRPGLRKFLENVSQLYELHIYTMGTRLYAQNIAEIVDPDHRIFGDRILSRNESGSMNVKSLQRLFPVDTKMVVIIDDRADVWKWSPNLIKVKAYDFFVGIGDINSSFLPKKPELKIPKTRLKAPETASDSTEGTETKEPEPSTNGDQHVNPAEAAEVLQQNLVDSTASPLDRLVAMGGADDPANRTAQSTQQDETIAAQVEERPLLKKQKMLEEEGANAAAETTKDENDESKSVSEKSSESERPKQNLLHDQDQELYKLESHLGAVHKAFFEAHKQQVASSQGGRLGQLRGVHKRKIGPETSDLDLVPDIKDIMPRVKSNVLAGTVIVFSALFPQNVDMRTTDWGIQAAEFGARIDSKVTKRTTHLVAAPKRTDKVKLAQHKRNWDISIVSRHWLEDCFSSWMNLDEDPYLLDIEGPKDDASFLDEDSYSNTDDDSQIDEDSDEGEVETPERIDGKPVKLRLTTRTPPLDDDHESEVDSGETAEFEYDNKSPVGTKEDWDEMDAALQDFLGSEDEEEDDDNKSNASQASNASTVSIRAKKRSREDYESGEESDDEKVKKKQTTGTSLSQTTLVDSNDGTTDPQAGNEDPVEDGPKQEGDGWSDFDEDDFDAELEEAESEEQEASLPV